MHRLYTIIVLHNTAQNSSDNVSSHPPDNHHSLMEGRVKGQINELYVGSKLIFRYYIFQWMNERMNGLNCLF